MVKTLGEMFNAFANMFTPSSWRNLDKQLSGLPVSSQPMYSCKMKEDEHPGCTYNEETKQWESVHPPIEKIIYRIRASSNKADKFHADYPKLEDAAREFNDLREALKSYVQWWSPTPKACNETFTASLTNVSYVELIQIHCLYEFEDGEYKLKATKKRYCVAPDVTYDTPPCNKKKKKK
jgi:hypothetical protein